MRIGIIADPIDNQSAGVHVYTKEMVLSLLQQDRVNEYIIIRQKKGEEIDKSYTNVKEIVVANSSLPIGYASLRLFLIIPFIFRREKVDVVIEPAHFGPFNLPKSIKRITVIHDLTPILFPEWHRWHSGVLQKIFLPHILKRTDYILTNSLTTENELHRIYPFTRSKTWMIYPGFKNLVPVDNETAFIEKYHTASIPYFLFVGTLEPRKNLSLLLDAFTIFKSKTLSKTRLIIAGGKGWKNEAFFERFNQHPFKNDIVITGYLSNEELSFLYRHALAFIYPSQYEGFGFPVIEAMSAGTQVITTAKTSMDEITSPYATTFRNNDPQDLADKMVQIAPLHSDSSKIKDLKLVAEKYDWFKFANMLINKLQLMNKILNEN